MAEKKLSYSNNEALVIQEPSKPLSSREKNQVHREREKEKSIHLLKKLQKEGYEVDNLLEFFKRPKKEIRVDIITG